MSFYLTPMNSNQSQNGQMDSVQNLINLSMQKNAKEQLDFYAAIQNVFKINMPQRQDYSFAYPRFEAPRDKTSTSGDYVEKLKYAESRGQYGVTERKHGNYLGAYQLGKAVLTDIGYMDKNGNWTGKNGIYSKEQFLASPQIQDSAQAECMQKQWKYLNTLGATKYIGKSFTAENGERITITKSSLLAGAHLSGPAGISSYLNKIIQWEEGGRIGQRPSAPRDGNNYSAETRMAAFGNYDVSGTIA